MKTTVSIQDLLDELEARDVALDRLVATCMKLETENQQLKEKIYAVQGSLLAAQFGIRVPVLGEA